MAPEKLFYQLILILHQINELLTYLSISIPEYYLYFFHIFNYPIIYLIFFIHVLTNLKSFFLFFKNLFIISLFFIATD